MDLTKTKPMPNPKLRGASQLRVNLPIQHQNAAALGELISYGNYSQFPYHCTAKELLSFNHPICNLGTLITWADISTLKGYRTNYSLISGDAAKLIEFLYQLNKGANLLQLPNFNLLHLDIQPSALENPTEIDTAWGLDNAWGSKTLWGSDDILITLIFSYPTENLKNEQISTMLRELLHRTASSCSSKLRYALSEYQNLNIKHGKLIRVTFNVNH